MTKATQRHDKSSIARFYDSMGPVYARMRQYGHNRDGSTKTCLVDALTPFEDDIILDIGTGPGMYAIDIATAAPSCRVVGIDISETFIDIAKESALSAKINNVEFALGNIESLGFADNHFSKIICAGVISVVHQRKQAINELARVLRPGGTLAVREPCRSTGAFSRFVFGLPAESRIRGLCTNAGLLGGHFSPGFMSKTEIEDLFSETAFSSVAIEEHGRDILITATR